ncbi:MAG: hypothetical protein K2Q20_08625 [Phycisphaerales bacterium]|nr:hypothetical protein [Phycisphaerales bacterium]
MQTTQWPPDAALKAFRGHLQLQGLSTDLDAAIAAGGTVRRTLWSGHLHNAAALLLAALTVFSALRSAARLRQAARLARSLCPHCRYDLTGLPPQTSLCPECGNPIASPQPSRSQPAHRDPSEPLA